MSSHIQDIPLTDGAAGDHLFRPIRPGTWISAEHPFPRAGRVHQHPVEPGSKMVSQSFGSLIGDGNIASPPAFQVDH